MRDHLLNSKGLFLLTFLFSFSGFTQVGTNGADRSEKGRPVKTYDLFIEQGEVTLNGVTAKGMTINGSIPGPTLEFNEGDLAVINVHNKMVVETSVHWHGLILPNFYDGVPYITTPPIKPDSTFQYRIPINQSGTYWYHSHTMLQEQSGVIGSIIIHPKEKTLEYDKDLVVFLSDWTNMKPEHVLKNLKRRNEWFQVAKGTAVPLSQAIGQGGLGAQLKMWRDRMEGADIADVYYPTFLINGKNVDEHPDFKPGEKIRLRIINGSASTYFWVDIGGGMPMMVSADGADVKPVHKKRYLHAIAETYDIIITVPDGKLEITATAQDGSGHTSIHLGNGKLIPAKVIDRPDKVEMMKIFAEMDMKMGAPALKANPKKDDPMKLMHKYGMKMDHDMEHGDMNMNDHMMGDSMMKMDMDHDSDVFDYPKRKTYFDYDYLSALSTTTLPENITVNELLFNLTGNMNRYVWSINGIPVSENDKVKIKKGEATRITLNNLTMMHHPMHLHGHYFRVINKNGERSPLKHTVNVPPMQKVTIEFYNEEEADWFFHCHVLYHMMSGMTRVFSYGTERHPEMIEHPEKILIGEMDQFFSWGTAEIGSHFSEIRLVSSSIRNEFMVLGEYGYKKELELDVSYNRYINDWWRWYIGGNLENENRDLNDLNPVAKIGLRYFTPYMFMVDLSLDHQLRPEIGIDKEFMLFPRTFLEGEFSYRPDFGLVNELPVGSNYEQEIEWKVGMEFMLNRNFSLMGNYHSKYKWGGGLTIRF